MAAPIERQSWHSYYGDVSRFLIGSVRPNKDAAPFKRQKDTRRQRWIRRARAKSYWLKLHELPFCRKVPLCHNVLERFENEACDLIDVSGTRLFSGWNNCSGLSG